MLICQVYGNDGSKSLKKQISSSKIPMFKIIYFQKYKYKERKYEMKL